LNPCIGSVQVRLLCSLSQDLAPVFFFSMRGKPEGYSSTAQPTALPNPILPLDFCRSPPPPSLFVAPPPAVVLVDTSMAVLVVPVQVRVLVHPIPYGSLSLLPRDRRIRSQFETLYINLFPVEEASLPDPAIFFTTSLGHGS